MRTPVVLVAGQDDARGTGRAVVEELLKHLAPCSSATPSTAMSSSAP